MKIVKYCDCVILLRSGWPSQIPDEKGVNAKKSGSGDQTYLRAENERGTAGDETKAKEPKRLLVLSRILVPARKRWPQCLVPAILLLSLLGPTDMM